MRIRSDPWKNIFRLHVVNDMGGVGEIKEDFFTSILRKAFFFENQIIPLVAYRHLSFSIGNLVTGTSMSLPHRSSLIWISCIRICIGNVDPDPGARKLTKILIYHETSSPSFRKGNCTVYLSMFYDPLHCP
jgi:hypothetical protein